MSQLSLKIRQVLNQDTLKVSVFEPKFLQLIKFRRDIFTACQNLSQQFYHSPDFEKTYLQRVQFWMNDVKLCSSSSQIFTTRQILIRDFYSVSDFEITFLPTLSFWIEKKYKGPDFRKSLILGEQISLEFRILKDNFWCNLHPKNETVGISVISWKSIFRERLFWRRNENNSRIKTSKASYIFFSISWQRVLSQIEKLKK